MTTGRSAPHSNQEHAAVQSTSQLARPAAPRRGHRGCGTLPWLALLVIVVLPRDAQGQSAAEATVESSANRPAVTRLTKSYFSKFFLNYSPDGSHLTYSRHHDHRRAANKILMSLRIVQSDGSDDRPLLAAYDSQVQIQEHGAWSPDGKSLLVTGGGNDTGNAAKDTFICDVDEQFHASNLRKILPGDAVQLGEWPNWSPDGRQIVVAQVNRTLTIVDADGGNRRALIQTAGHYCFQPVWSPDGRWVAFASDRDGNCELYKIRADGTQLTRLTNDPSIDCRPKWSPDAQWLAFTSNRTGNEEIHLMRADGSQLVNLTQDESVDDHPAWSPDGHFLSFVSMRDGGFDIYRLEVPTSLKIGSEPRPVSDEPVEPQADLVLHYTFDDADGTLVRDQGAGNHLQLAGAALIRSGKRGVIEFDGQDDVAAAGNGTALQIGGPLTISLWVRPEAQVSNGYLLAKHGWNLYLGPDLIPRFETRSAKDDAWETLDAAAPLPVGEWTFLVAIFDPAEKNLRIHVNGQRSAVRARVDGALGAVAGYPLELGTYNVTHSQYYRGQLDELRIYRRVLDDDEILRAYEDELAAVGLP